MKLRSLVSCLRDVTERRSPQERRAAILAKRVFARLKSYRKQYNLKGEARSVLKDPIEGVAWIELILKWDPDIEPHVPAKAPWVHKGQLGRAVSGKVAIRLTWRLAHSFIDDWMLEPLSHDIAGVIRHELEHSTQSRAGTVGSPESRGGDWGNVAMTREYLLNPKEVEAFSTQVYMQAKRQKVPVTVPLGDKLDRLEKALRRRKIDPKIVRDLVADYRTTVLTYILRRYPDARVGRR